MITCYCKKCAQDVPRGETCPYCGGKLLKSSARVVWCVEHEPVGDWMSWNAAARVLLPVYGAIFLMLLLGEAVTGGMKGVQRFLAGAVIPFALLLLISAALLLILLILRGRDLVDCIVDSKGIHVRTWLTDPTPVRLMLRFRSPSLMERADTSGEVPVVLIDEKNLAWNDIARVQLWPEKTLILLYAPGFWMRLCLYCTPFIWDDVLTYMRDKVGRKKTLLLPRELVAPAKPKTAGRKKSAVPEQVRNAAADTVRQEMPEIPGTDAAEDLWPPAGEIPLMREDENFTGTLYNP